MQQLPQTYLAQIASQMGFLSAFLGGVAATLLALLLDDKPHRRVVTWAVGLAAAAAVAFIIAVVCSTMLVSVLHPDAPDHLVRQASINRARAFGTLSFLLGLYLLLACIALSGWIRSRPTGIATTAVSAFGVFMVTWGAFGF